jgi:hypothetical protein
VKTAPRWTGALADELSPSPIISTGVPVLRLRVGERERFEREALNLLHRRPENFIERPLSLDGRGMP